MAARSRSLRCLTLAGLLAVAGCAAPEDAAGPSLPGGLVRLAEVAPDSAEAGVLAELDGLYADLSDRDWDAFADHFWPGATMTTLWQPPGELSPRVVVSTVPDFVKQAPAGPGSREIFEERMVDADVRVHGPMAHVWSRFDARFGDPGSIVEWQGIDAFTLFEHGGRWKVVSVSYVADP
jgi:hypothetical protein